MTTITFKGQPIHTIGQLPALQSNAPDFVGTNADLKEIKLSEFHGKKVVLNIFPSLDTAVCAMSMQAFNRFAGTHPGLVVLCLSMDLPFAQKRFCEHGKVLNVLCLSLFRAPDFGKTYGVTMTDGPLRGLMSRAVVVMDEGGKIIYTEQVPEITLEPNYKAVQELLR